MTKERMNMHSYIQHTETKFGCLTSQEKNR